MTIQRKLPKILKQEFFRQEEFVNENDLNDHICVCVCVKIYKRYDLNDIETLPFCIRTNQFERNQIKWRPTITTIDNDKVNEINHIKYG